MKSYQSKKYFMMKRDLKRSEKTFERSRTSSVTFPTHISWLNCNNHLCSGLYSFQSIKSCAVFINYIVISCSVNVLIYFKVSIANYPPQIPLVGFHCVVVHLSSNNIANSSRQLKQSSLRLAWFSSSLFQLLPSYTHSHHAYHFLQVASYTLMSDMLYYWSYF